MSMVPCPTHHTRPTSQVRRDPQHCYLAVRVFLTGKFLQWCGRAYASRASQVLASGLDSEEFVLHRLDFQMVKRWWYGILCSLPTSAGTQKKAHKTPNSKSQQTKETQQTKVHNAQPTPHSRLHYWGGGKPNPAYWGSGRERRMLAHT